MTPRLCSVFLLVPALFSGCVQPEPTPVVLLAPSTITFTLDGRVHSSTAVAGEYLDPMGQHAQFAAEPMQVTLRGRTFPAVVTVTYTRSPAASAFSPPLVRIVEYTANGAYVGSWQYDAKNRGTFSLGGASRQWSGTFSGTDSRATSNDTIQGSFANVPAFR